MDDKLLSEISRKLNVLIALKIRQLSGDSELSNTKKRKAGVGDAARYLSDFGLSSADVAQILGAPLGSVRTLLTPKRKK
jgi:hypothetical protein